MDATRPTTRCVTPIPPFCFLFTLSLSISGTRVPRNGILHLGLSSLNLYRTMYVLVYDTCFVNKTNLSYTPYLSLPLTIKVISPVSCGQLFNCKLVSRLPSLIPSIYSSPTRRFVFPSFTVPGHRPRRAGQVPDTQTCLTLFLSPPFLLRSLLRRTLINWFPTVYVGSCGQFKL